jgi:hypothetical protein
VLSIGYTYCGQFSVFSLRSSRGEMANKDAKGEQIVFRTSPNLFLLSQKNWTPHPTIPKLMFSFPKILDTGRLKFQVWCVVGFLFQSFPMKISSFENSTPFWTPLKKIHIDPNINVFDTLS